MKIDSVIAVIEEFAPLSLQEKWDNSGLQVGDTNGEITGVVVALDVRMEVIEKAIECGANLIISHHPLLLGGLKSITNRTAQGAMVIRAIENNITIYSSHTPSDSTSSGLNDHIVSLLDLHQVQVLESSSGGLCRVGVLKHSVSVTAFCELLKCKLSLPCVRFNANGDRVHRVALCSGSGASMIDMAIQSGADTYICGDLKYHDYQRVDGLMSIFDIGHYESEIFFTDIITNLIDQKILKNSKKSATFALHTYKDNFISYYGH